MITRLRMLMWIPLYPFYLIWYAGYKMHLWGRKL